MTELAVTGSVGYAKKLTVRQQLPTADLFKTGYGKSDLATLLAGIKMFE